MTSGPSNYSPRWKLIIFLEYTLELLSTTLDFYTFHSLFNEHPAGLRSEAAGHSCVIHLFQQIEKKKTFQQLEKKKTFQSRLNEHPAGLRSEAAGHSCMMHLCPQIKQFR